MNFNLKPSPLNSELARMRWARIVWRLSVFFSWVVVVALLAAVFYIPAPKSYYYIQPSMTPPSERASNLDLLDEKKDAIQLKIKKDMEELSGIINIDVNEIEALIIMKGLIDDPDKNDRKDILIRGIISSRKEFEELPSPNKQQRRLHSLVRLSQAKQWSREIEALKKSRELGISYQEYGEKYDNNLSKKINEKNTTTYLLVTRVSLCLIAIIASIFAIQYLPNSMTSILNTLYRSLKRLVA